VIHEIHRVIGLEQVADFTLKLDFADGTSQTIDFAPVLAGEIYGPLSDPTFFRQVRLDSEFDTIVWPNGADFDPADLHDWPSVRDDFVKLVQSWAPAPA
jgi:hypothetical protein